MNRQGWSRFLVTKMLTRLGLKPQTVLGCTAPTAISRLHDVAKISCGYPRMIAPAVLGLVQLVTGHGFYRSTNTIVALALIFVFEVLEDICHHLEVLPFAPVPKAAAEYFASLDRYSPYQSTVPVMPREDSQKLPYHRSSPSLFPRKTDEPASPSSLTSLPASGFGSEDTEIRLPPRRKSVHSVSSAISTGGVEAGVAGQVRRWWGQDLKVHMALRLWHLRSWSGPQPQSTAWIERVRLPYETLQCAIAA